MQAQGRLKAPSARTFARLMGMGRDHLTKADTVIVAPPARRVPAGVAASAARHQLARRRGQASVAGWPQPRKHRGEGRFGRARSGAFKNREFQVR